MNSQKNTAVETLLIVNLTEIVQNAISVDLPLTLSSTEIGQFEKINLALVSSQLSKSQEVNKAIIGL